MTFASQVVECSGFIISFIGIIYAPTDKYELKEIHSLSKASSRDACHNKHQ